jgi:hypothetical protein
MSKWIEISKEELAFGLKPDTVYFRGGESKEIEFDRYEISNYYRFNLRILWKDKLGSPAGTTYLDSDLELMDRRFYYREA